MQTEKSRDKEIQKHKDKKDRQNQRGGAEESIWCWKKIDWIIDERQKKQIYGVGEKRDGVEQTDLKILQRRQGGSN